MTYATYEPRSAWNARPARGSTALAPSTVVGEALHWPGTTKPINAVGAAGKARVASALRGWQNYHMDDRGWSDIAYQIAVDQVGRAWTLRGLNIRSGANGDANVNRLYGAFLLVLAPGEEPSAAMKATVQNVIRDFRAHMPKASATPKGHKDVRVAGTDCPGPLAYAAIKRGDFTPRASTPPKEIDVQLTDRVGPDRSDPNGGDLTLGEAANRGGYAYWNTMEGGPLFELVQAQKAEIAELKAAVAALQKG